jgi:branched-subunit amino acid ABC-type transport system permease component
MQFAANVVLSSAFYALVAIGFLVGYQTRREFDFSYAALYTIAPYVMLLCCRSWGFPIFSGAIIGICSSLLVALFVEIAIYRPMRRNGANSLIIMIASLGILILVQNVLSISFGDEARTLRTWAVTEGHCFMGARLTTMQVITILCSSVLVPATYIFLRFTGIGKRMRAVACDKELAWTTGVRVDLILLWAYLVSALLAGVSAILVGLDTDLTPTMGFPAFMVAVVVCIVGGVGYIFGAIAGAVLISLAQQLGVWTIGSQWQDAIAFMTLLIFLLFRPQGFLGKKVKTATL